MLWRIKIIFLGVILAVAALFREICLSLGLYQIPETFYKLALKIRPAKRAGLLQGLGFVYERARMFEKAKECYEEARKFEPSNSSHYWELGFIYEKQNKIDLAIESYEKALQLGTELGKEFKDEIQSRIAKLKG